MKIGTDTRKTKENKTIITSPKDIQTTLLASGTEKIGHRQRNT